MVDLSVKLQRDRYRTLKFCYKEINTLIDMSHRDRGYRLRGKQENKKPET